MPPFFIVSSGRSGTTLLSSILNSSNHVAILPESDFIARAFPFYNEKSSFTKKDYFEIIKIFQKTSLMNGWKIDPNRLIEAFNMQRPKSFAELNLAIYEAYLAGIGKKDSQWGIKMPNLIFSLDRIFAVFPDAKILNLVRDGRDVALSYQRIHENGHGFGPNNIFECALYWIVGLRRIIKQKNSSILEIKYEDLLLEADETLRAICGFLGIENTNKFDTRHFSDKDLAFIPADHRKTIHEKVNEGLDKGNINKYKKNMKKRQIFIFELLAAPYLKRYNYKLEYPFLKYPIFGIIRVPLYLCAAGLNDIRYKLREIRIFKSIA